MPWKKPLLRIAEIALLFFQVFILSVYIYQALTVGGGMDRAMLIQVAFPVIFLPMIGTLVLVFAITQLVLRDRFGFWIGFVQLLFVVSVYCVSLDLHLDRLFGFSLMFSCLMAGTAFILLVRASVR